jgi:large subunit ribosomal protein L22
MKEVQAHLRFLRMSPRKVRLVADLIRGRKAERAVTILSVLNKVAAEPILKLLKSAMANAEHNFSLSVPNLKVATITVDGGPSLKRWMPKAHGRATPVREPTSHITIILSELKETAPVAQEEKAEKVIDATEVTEEKTTAKPKKAPAKKKAAPKAKTK